MILTSEIAKEIIDLNPSGRIDSDIASRQFEVIVKGFNFLSNPEHNFLYIADEVGLGKTYIALGIASLLRYFSDHPDSYTDMIIVPKANLQLKWQKEINQFIKYNFKQKSNRVKSVTNHPVARCGEQEIHDDLRWFNNHTPSYQIYRKSSFSMARRNEDHWYEKFADRLAPEYRTAFIDGARKVGGDEVLVRHLFAYLFNCSLPKIDLLIVDEAHNFKHGTGREVSYRNQVASRVFGVTKENDKILEVFPELKQQVNPKASKVIFLSATPIDRGLYEIKNQMDCFLPQHQFSHIEDSTKLDQSIKESLHSFLIRGVMNITLKNGERFTRNMYRHEHRQGNVDKASQKPQKIEGDLQSIVIGLLQYKTIKELHVNHGNRFEIGLLAGFESFAESSTAREYEQTATREEKTSKDQHIVQQIVNSYYDTFHKYLPHPKQEKLVEVLNPYLKLGEKALIFVRRIASVRELEQKLLRKYEEIMVKKIEALKLDNNDKVQQLLRQYEEQRDHQNLKSTLDLLALRLIKHHSGELEGFIASKASEEEDPEGILSKELLDIYEGESNSNLIREFRDATRGHFNRKKIKSAYRQLALECYLEFQQLPRDENLDPDEEDVFEERSSYFFDRFFAKKSGPGGRFRKRSYTQDWYSINYYLVYQICTGWDKRFNTVLLQSKIELKDADAKKPVKRFEARQYLFIQALSQAGKYDSTISVPKEYEYPTFLTNLLLGPCLGAFRDWLDFYWNKDRPEDLCEHLDMLNEVLRGIFRNGSGLLPAYLADCKRERSFSDELLDLLTKTFPHVIKEVNTILRDFEDIRRSNFSDTSKIKRLLYHQTPVTGLSGHHRRDVSKTAAQFRMPGYPYILIATDIVKEGEDLHAYCKEIFHYGIAWNPSDMEQRTGRIDRIGSHCYKGIKDKESIQLDDKIHVFFPYLADTLEVNQVVKVFEGMNQFIETFYDFSKTVDREYQAEVDSVINDIPPQISSRLESKYDHQAFAPSASDMNGTHCELLPCKGMGEHELLEKLTNLKKELYDKFEFFSGPDLKNGRHEIQGTINLDGRRAPFSIKVVNGNDLGRFNLQLWSSICSKSDLKSRSDQERIELELRDRKLGLTQQNNLLIAQGIYSFEDRDLMGHLQEVCEVADNLEKDFTGDQDHEFDF